MSKKLRLLILESSPPDAELDVAVLEEAGYSCKWQRVETREDFVSKLSAGSYDLILCDYSLPSFDGHAALKIYAESGLDIPFIFVSGTPGEELAIESLKAGATDYVLKQNLARLAPVVTRALREQHERRERERAERVPRENEERLRLMIEGVRDYAIFMLDTLGNVASWNSGAEHVKGWKAEEILGKYYAIFYAPEDRVNGLPERAIEVARDAGQFKDEGWRLQKDGSRYWARVTLSPVHDEAGVLRGFVNVLQDVTERKRAIDGLRESEQRLQAILDNSPALIFAEDAGYRYTFVNRQFETLFNVSREEVRGKTAYDVFPKEVAARLVESSRKVLEGAAAQEFEDVLPYDQSPHTYITVKFPLYDSESNLNGICSISTDITERKHLEDQLRQAQKMEAVGRLAGGVAHDFNNLLTAIIGYSQLVLSSVASDESLRKEVEEILKAGKRAASLTSQLLAFSRRQVLQPEVINLNNIVSSTTKMLGRLIGEDVQLITELDPALGNVKADPGQVEQVIMNLAVNARDAMPDGGKLTIGTANVYLDEAYAREHINVQPGPHVMLAVSDTGCGMDTETRARIFEPFFTTKGESKGTGLGLSMVYGIVKQSGGDVWVYSGPGQGTTFKLYLPRVEEANGAALQHNELTQLPRGNETILLVEDEQAVRELTARVLRELGYTVLVAERGYDAVQLAGQHRDREIHLLLTDVVMPGMSGKMLTEIIKAARPEIKVLFSSGYTDNTLVHHAAISAGAAFLQKPFTPITLARKVREVLDSK